MKSRFSHAAAFGLITSMAVIALGLILYLADLRNSSLNYLSYPIAITIAVLGVKKWREQSGGYLTFGQTYAHLMLQTVVYAIIITVWTLVFLLLIAPGALEDQMLIEQAKMEDRGMSAAEVDMAMSMARKFTSPPVLGMFAFFGNMLMLGLIHLIVAAIVKKDPPPAQFFPPTSVPPQNGPHGNSPYGQNPYSNPPQNFPPQQ